VPSKIDVLPSDVVFPSLPNMASSPSNNLVAETIPPFYVSFHRCTPLGHLLSDLSFCEFFQPPAQWDHGLHAQLVDILEAIRVAQLHSPLGFPFRPLDREKSQF
jgi:hypothetical protein